MRTCISCRARRPKRDLVRLVRAADGMVALDVQGRGEGRGAYVCRKGSCLRSLWTDKRLKRAFRADGPIGMQPEVLGGVDFRSLAEP